MSTTLKYPHIDCPVDEPARLSRLPRIRVAQIAMDYLAHGWSADEICRQYSHLRLAEVHAAMTYYFDHQAEIDGEIRAELDQAGKEAALDHASPLATRLRAKGVL